MVQYSLAVWLSLSPFGTAYLTSTHGAPIAIAVYASLGTITAVAFLLLGLSLSRRNVDVEVVRRVTRSRQPKSAIAILINLSAVPLAFVSKPLAFALLSLPALAYFLLDKRVEL